MEQFFNLIELSQLKYDKYVWGQKKKRKNRGKIGSHPTHAFLKTTVIPKTYGKLQHRATTVHDMVKMIMVYKSNADSKCKIFLD